MTKDELNQLIAESGLGGRSAKKLLDAYERQQPAAQPVEAPAQAAAPTKKSASKPKKQPVAAGHGAPTPGRKPSLTL